MPNKSLAVVLTSWLDNLEKVCIAVKTANNALAADLKVALCLQAEGVHLAVQGAVDQLNFPGYLPLKELLNTFFEMGGRMLVCITCLNIRNISKESIIAKAQISTMDDFIKVFQESDIVLNY